MRLLAFYEAVLETSARSGNLIGYSFRVDPATRGRRFTLRAIDAPMSDLDITFDAFDEFASRAGGGERGIVPITARWAHVCMHTGAATEFVYAARRTTSLR